MNSKSKKEKQIIIATCIATVGIVSGFTIVQGTIKAKEDNYISQQIQSEIKISKDSYEIIKNENIKEENKYVILQKEQLSSDEIALLAKEIAKENFDKFELYIFDNREKAINFNGLENQLEKIVAPIGNDIQIQTYNIIENEIESIPKNYEVKSVEPKESITKIELEIESTDKPETALAEVKFLGQSIKDLNSDKNLGNLNIQAYHINDRNVSWNYSSANKSRIIKTEIVEM